MYISNKDVSLSLHKECFGGLAQDFVIRFKKEETCINDIISISSDIVKGLIDDYLQRGKIVKGRLVARILYISVVSEEIVQYYHPSYQSEIIHDAKDFYQQHMLKIAQRMDNFNRNGSNLLIERIEEVHLHLSIVN